MSLDKLSVHVRLSQEMHDRLAVLAGVANDPVAEFAAYLLEKSIVGEFHAVSMQAMRLRRLGLTGNDRECEGSTGNSRDSQGSGGCK